MKVSIAQILIGLYPFLTVMFVVIAGLLFRRADNKCTADQHAGVACEATIGVSCLVFAIMTLIASTSVNYALIDQTFWRNEGKTQAAPAAITVQIESDEDD